MSRGVRLIATGLVAIGAGAMSFTAHDRVLEVPGFGIAVVALIAFASQWFDGYARADGIERVLLMARAGVVVIEDRISIIARGQPFHDSRVSSWRIRDGVRVAHVAGEPELHVLGPAGEAVWCSSASMPVHVRDPLTLDVIHDERAVRGTSGVTLKRVRVGASDNPVFDPTSGGVHAFASDGRGYLIGPDLTVTESPRAAVGKPPRAEPATFAMVSPDAQRRALREVTDAIRERVTQTLVTPERVVLIVGPSKTELVGSGMHAELVGGREGHAAIGLDPATGAIAWRWKL